MICPNCQQEIADNVCFCKHCGCDVKQATVSIPTPPMPPIPVPPVSQIPAPPMPPVPQPQEFTEDMLPEQYRPLSPWAYFGLTLLFSVPIVGFVFLIIFSCKRSNINRRNFARSYWCTLLVAAAVVLLLVLIAVATGASLASMLDY